MPLTGERIARCPGCTRLIEVGYPCPYCQPRQWARAVQGPPLEGMKDEGRGMKKANSSSLIPQPSSLCERCGGRRNGFNGLCPRCDARPRGGVS
jgi:hypothetical protein